MLQKLLLYSKPLRRYSTVSFTLLNKQGSICRIRSSSTRLLSSVVPTEQEIKMMDPTSSVPYGVRSSNELLEFLKMLDSRGICLPLSTAYNVSDVLIKRLDIGRLELLMYLCEENWAKYENNNKKYNPSTKLNSYCITGLYRVGEDQEAMKLWMRLTSHGFVTSKFGLEKMLDRIVGNPKSEPSLEFIDSLHNAMTSQLWHQNSAHYVRLFKIYYHHIIHVCKTEEQLEQVINKVEAMWQEQISWYFPFATTELQAIRLQCFAAAILVTYRINPSSNKIEYIRSRSIEIFKTLLSMQGTQNSKPSISKDDYKVDRIADEIQTILKACYTSDSVTNRKISEDKFDKVDSASYEAGTSEGTVRRAVQDFLGNMMKTGHRRETVALLFEYLGRSPISDQKNMKGQYTNENSEVFYRCTHDDESKFNMIRKNIVDESRDSGGNIADVLEKSAIASIHLDLDRNNQMNAHSAESGSVSNSSRKTKVLPKDRIAGLYTMSEKSWIEYILCTVMRSFIVRSNDRIDNGTLGEWSAYSSIYELYIDLNNIAASLDAIDDTLVHDRASLVVSFLDCLANNLPVQSSTAVNPLDMTWEGVLAASCLVTGSSPHDHRFQNTDVLDAVIRLLCTAASQVCTTPGANTKAIVHAIKLIGSFKKSNVAASEDVLCDLLDASTQSLNNEELELLVNQISALLKSTDSQSVKILRSLIFANARLQKGFQSLSMLQQMRQMGGYGNMRLYKWVIKALYLTTAETDAEWATATQPEQTVNFLIREMQRDGLKLDEELIALLLRLYTKAVPLAAKVGDAGNVLKAMDRFLFDHCARKGNRVSSSGKKTSRVTENLLREIVKAHCLAGQEMEAIQIVEKAESDYGVKLTSCMIIEPLLFHYASLRGLTVTAEDLLTMLTNKGLPVTDTVVSSFVYGHLRKGNRVEALDCIIGIFNQYSVRPPVVVWMHLLDASLEIGDVYEARRIVYFIDQYYTSLERTVLVGPSSIATSHKFRSNENSSDDFPDGIDLRLGVPLEQREKGVLSEEKLILRFRNYGLSLSD